MSVGQMGQQTTREPGETAGATVLVVDDNEANRALARETLEDEGYRVLLATGGAAAVDMFEREAPDCILLDVRMPEVDGFAACERIRTLPRGTETPIIFVTALRDVDTFDRALQAGGDDFLTKPVRPAELVVRVETALKLRRMRTELREHYELLKHQRDDLLRIQLQKERLMAFVVHDLKNPVNSMDLHAQLLQRDRNLSEKSRESVIQIRTEARQLARMIQNLLDLSKADEGKLSPGDSEVDLRALVADVFAELEVSARVAGVRLKASVEVDRLTGDEDLFKRMVVNLVENAIRHAPRETTVTVSAMSYPDRTEIRIADAGSGVPVEMREQIFGAFVQAAAGSSARVARTGRGLGLAFCKLAAEAHGGTIRVENAEPGAVFCVALPRERH